SSNSCHSRRVVASTLLSPLNSNSSALPHNTRMKNMSQPFEFRPTIPFNRAAALRAARIGARLLVISGGRPGVGATTLAVKLAVMDTYALIKTLISRYAAHRQVSLVVNQSPDAATSADVHRRIDQSCQRFLGLTVDFAGGVPPHSFDGDAVGEQSPFDTAISRL